MRRRLLIFILLFMIVGTAYIFPEDTKVPRLAVIEFDVSDHNNARLVNDAISIRNQIQSTFIKMGRYDVIARSEIDSLLENQRIAISSISDKENIKKLQLYQIAYLVTGTVDALDDKYFLTINLLDVGSGKFIHSDNTLIGNSATDIYKNTESFVYNFIYGLKNDGVELVNELSQRKAMSNAYIHVETKAAGTLYLYDSKTGNWKEVESLWDNDSYDITIERPATYYLKIRHSDGTELKRSVIVDSKRMFNVFFMDIGDIGPGGGTVFYIDDYYIYECVELPGEHDWNTAIQICTDYSGGEHSDWNLPTWSQLDKIYQNLRKVNKISVNGFFWSSSVAYSSSYLGNTTSISNAKMENFDNGSYISSSKTNKGHVFAVRAF